MHQQVKLRLNFIKCSENAYNYAVTSTASSFVSESWSVKATKMLRNILVFYFTINYMVAMPSALKYKK